MSCPTDELMAAAQRVLMYLSHHRAVGLRFFKAQLPVSGFSDSDWATKHSTSAAISWASKKQPSVALSSCEAKIIAASEAAKKAVHLRSLFADLGLSPEQPTTLALDNKSAIDLAYNPEHHQRSKHIDRRYFLYANASNLTTSRSPSSTARTTWLISLQSRCHRGCSLRCATSS
eukprot:3028974-Pleurochrysis_carterae.AAC.1